MSEASQKTELGLLQDTARFLNAVLDTSYTTNDKLSFLFKKEDGRCTSLYTTVGSNIMKTAENILAANKEFTGRIKDIAIAADKLLNKFNILMVYKSTHFDGDRCLAIHLSRPQKVIELVWLDRSSIKDNVDRIVKTIA